METVQSFLAGTVAIAEFNLARLREVAIAFEEGDKSENSVWKCKGLACFYGRNDQAAIHYFNVLCATDPTADNFGTLALALLRNGESERAAEAAKRCIELDADCAAGHQVLAATYLMSGSHEAALLEAQRAYELQPDDPRNSALVNLASTKEIAAVKYQESSWLMEIGRPQQEGWLGRELGLQMLVAADVLT